MIEKCLPHLLQCYLKRTPAINKSKILDNTVVSFTTTPPRINKIWPTINSILLQSQLPEKIYLWIPKHYTRFNNQTITNLPNFLKHPLIEIIFIEKDWGPATKLLPCLTKFQDQPEKKIIVIDDDRIYPTNLIEQLYQCSLQNKQAVVATAGSNVRGSKIQKYTKSRRVQAIDVVYGYTGYLVKPTFFTPEVFSYPVDIPEAFFEDDVWFSGHLHRNQVPRLLIPTTQIGIQNILLYNGCLSSALCEQENKDWYNFNKTWAYFNA